MSRADVLALWIGVTLEPTARYNVRSPKLEGLPFRIEADTGFVFSAGEIRDALLADGIGIDLDGRLYAVFGRAWSYQARNALARLACASEQCGAV